MRELHGILPTALMALLLAPEAARAQSIDGAKVVELARGLYTITGWEDAGNPAFFVTGQGVVVVDSGESPERGRAIVAKVRETTDQPIKYLILTHYHGDHTYGVQSFPEGTIVIGSQELAANILRFNAEEAKGYRMLGAILDVGGQLHFVKCYGPQKTVDAHAAEFRSFIQSFQLKRSPK